MLWPSTLTLHIYTGGTQELDVNMFSLLVYPLRSRGKDGHFADAQIVSG